MDIPIPQVEYFDFEVNSKKKQKINTGCNIASYTTFLFVLYPAILF